MAVPSGSKKLESKICTMKELSFGNFRSRSGEESYCTAVSSQSVANCTSPGKICVKSP